MFNVDDLILNTLGAPIGFLIAPIVLAIIPSKEQVLQKSDRIFQAGMVRSLPQLLAILIDYIVVVISWFILSTLFKIDDMIIRFSIITDRDALLYIKYGFCLLRFSCNDDVTNDFYCFYFIYSSVIRSD